ncbi:MAG TPA: hypothetical protein VGN26_12190 [Armatimonadota bacterium]
MDATETEGEWEEGERVGGQVGGGDGDEATDAFAKEHPEAGTQEGGMGPAYQGKSQAPEGMAWIEHRHCARKGNLLT